MNKAVHVYWFTSDSSDKVHETIRYEDGRCSCSCPGWCKRNSPTQGRTCKHVRIVQAGQGHVMAKSHGPIGPNAQPVPAPVGYTKPKPQRRFEFD
jgi:hypothetical protein